MENYSSTNEILNAIKQRHSWDSDYKLAKKLGISRSRLSRYRCQNGNMEDDVVLECEKLLDMPEGTLLMQMHAIRTKCPAASNLFHEMAQKLAAGALCLVLVFSTAFAPAPAQAGQTDRINHSIHYAQLVRRARRVFWIGILPKLCLPTRLWEEFPKWPVIISFRFFTEQMKTINKNNDKNCFDGNLQ